MKLTRQGRDALRFIAKTLVDSGTKPYQSTATVISTNGKTATIRIDGAETTTPATLGVDVKPGDRVQVRVANSGVVVQGNNSAPPTDDAEALAAKVRAQLAKDAADTAQTTAESAQETADGALAAAESAQDTADGAASAAEATNQHFWHRDTDPDSDGAGTGAFVTDEEQDDFLSAIASGTAPTTARPLHNLLMNAEGILLRAATRIRAAFTPSGVAFYDGQGNQASNVNAAFGSDGFQVGRSGESHLTGDYHSLQLIDKDSSAYFHVSDLRGTDGTATVSMTPGSVTTSVLTLPIPATEVVSVTENGTTVDPSLYTLSSSLIVTAVGTTWDTTASYVVEFITDSRLSKAFTFGNRPSGSTTGAMSYAGGVNVTASGYVSHAEGHSTVASGDFSHAEGYNTEASGDFSSHAEGYSTVASGSNSHAEGISATASGAHSHAEGYSTEASGYVSHTEGSYTTASGHYSHAEGYNTEASGDFSHAEGSSTVASGDVSHAEGYNTTASVSYAHAEGYGTEASGSASHAQNQGTIAASDNQTALGRWNVADSQGSYAAIIGNGTSDSARSNALTVDWSGNVELAGSVKPGNVTAGRAAITGANGEVTTSSVTSTELYRLSGITSNVQNQIDAAKTTASVQHVTATLTVNIAANGSANGTLQATIPTGYTPVSVMCSALSNAFLMDLRVLSIDTSGLITYYIRNTSTSSAITGGTATFNVACVKTA